MGESKWFGKNASGEKYTKPVLQPSPFIPTRSTCRPSNPRVASRKLPKMTLSLPEGFDFNLHDFTTESWGEEDAGCYRVHKTLNLKVKREVLDVGPDEPKQVWYTTVRGVKYQKQ